MSRMQEERGWQSEKIIVAFVSNMDVEKKLGVGGECCACNFLVLNLRNASAWKPNYTRITI